MDVVELAKDFAAAPTEKALETIVELVRENPAAAIAIVGVLGVAYVTKLGLDSVSK